MMMARFVLTLLVGLVVSLGALVSGVEPLLAYDRTGDVDVVNMQCPGIPNFTEKRLWTSNISIEASISLSTDESFSLTHYGMSAFMRWSGEYKGTKDAEFTKGLGSTSISVGYGKRYTTGAWTKRDYIKCVSDGFFSVISSQKEISLLNNETPASDEDVCNMATYDKGWDKSSVGKSWREEAKRRGLSCGVGETTQTVLATNTKPTSDDDKRACRLASSGNVWWVKETKRRGLTCGVGDVGSSTQTASTPVPKAKPKVTSAALTAAEKEAERLRQELAALRAKQQQQQQTISSDTKLPTITIASALSNGPQGTVKGRVRDNTGIAEVRVDGKQIQIDRDGNFSANTYVPEGGVSVSIQAIDLAGLSSSMSVRLDRSASTTTASISFERLNPLGRKVAKNEDALALIIGVDGYSKTPARAIYADIDAKVFADYASQKLGIPTNRIKTLVNDGADESGMLLAVKDWLSRASKQGKSDVYVFFAGHGLASDDGQKMYLLPYDGSPRLLDDTAILRDRLFSDIASANPRSVTVFLDTCYSGTTRGTDMLIASRPIAIKALQQSIPDNFTVMTAARGDQTAKPLEEAKHGMFSYFLMKGMEGEADQNQDNKITAGELHSYVQQNVVQQSSGSQTPELQGDAERVLVRFQ